VRVMDALAILIAIGAIRLLDVVICDLNGA
jgi:hypothetical protein